MKMISAAAAASSALVTPPDAGQTPTKKQPERRKLDSKTRLLIDEFLVVRGKETSGSLMLNWRVRIVSGTAFGARVSLLSPPHSFVRFRLTDDVMSSAKSHRQYLTCYILARSE